MTSLVQLSLEAEFTRGHGALYDALAAGRIDEEALAALLTGTLPPLADGEQGRAWTGGARQSTTGCWRPRWRACPQPGGAGAGGVRAVERLRFAIDATPYPRPDAECSPEREHVHHDACRCDGTRKTIPGWEYQFLAASGTCAPRGPP